MSKRSKKPFNKHTHWATDPYHFENPNRYYHGAEIMAAWWVISFIPGLIIFLIGWIFDLMLIMQISAWWIMLGFVFVGPMLGYILGTFAYSAPPIKIIRKW